MWPYCGLRCRPIKVECFSEDIRWQVTGFQMIAGSFLKFITNMLRLCHALVTLYVQFLSSDWSKFDRWVHAENLCSILKLVYFDSWSWQSFVSPCDIFNCLFPLDVQNETQLLSRVFYYSCLVCLLGFWFRDASLVKVGNPISNGIVFVFHLAWCVLKRVQNSQAILALLDSFQEMHLEW